MKKVTKHRVIARRRVEKRERDGGKGEANVLPKLFINDAQGLDAPNGLYVLYTTRYIQEEELVKQTKCSRQE